MRTAPDRQHRQHEGYLGAFQRDYRRVHVERP